MRLRFAIVWLAALALVLCLDGIRGPAEQAPAPSTAVAPAGIDAGWWAQVQRDLSRAEYSVTWQERTCLPGLASAYQAPNRAQDLRTYFTPDGVRMTSRTRPGAGWEWGLRLAAYGVAGDLRAPEAAALAPRANRIEYRRGDLTEWYINDERGLEQGFTLARPPAGAAAKNARLVFELALTGNVLATALPDGAGLVGHTRDGVHVVDYTQLVAYDADGRDLPAAMRLADDGASVRLEVDATDARYPVTVDPLSTSPSWSITGGQEGMALGASVATAGDVNGDGYSDVIVGAPYSDNGAADEGEVVLYLGTATGLSTGSAWWVWGGRPNARLGWSVATAGDVNGDGYSDVVVGAPGYDIYASEGGGVFVWHGSASGLGAQHDLSDADWTRYSETAGDQLGFAVGTAGDVNTDGYSEIVIGAPYDDVAGVIDTGTIEVLFGSATGVSAVSRGVYLNQAGAHTGWTVGTAGDFNGDGYGDVFLVAPDLDGTSGVDCGKVVVLYGPDLGFTTTWSKEGLAAGAQFGYSVSTAGDVNGDGYGDIVIGAPGASNGQIAEGQAYVFHGAVNPATTPAWTAESDQAAAHLGKAVATAGDVNADGYADIVIGAPEYDNGQTDEGQVFAWWGYATGLGVSGTPANADWTAQGNLADARFGASLFLAGDVDGDGCSDVVVGAPNRPSPGGAAGVGAAYVFRGAMSGLAGNPGSSGSQASALLGYAVGPAGDVNGDGYADVMVAAPYYDNGQVNEGMVRVYLGAADWDGSGSYWSAEGDLASGLFGRSVGTAGDVNGDGYDDIIVGAPEYTAGNTNEGKAFVWYGSAAGLGANGTPLNADWTAEANQDAADFGLCVGTAGDVNGDGYSDVIVGSPTYDNAFANEGEIFVWYGSAAGLGANGTPLNADWFAESLQESAQLGGSAGTAGDVNGDGYSDIIAGAQYYDGATANEGAAFIWTGSATGPEGDASPANAAWRMPGGQAGARFGYSVGTAGDVDGDAYIDVIVGAPYYDNGETDEGGVFVYLGGPAGVATSPAVTKESNQANAHLGWVVGTVGDANGDGYADIVYTAPDYDGGVADAGQVIVCYGPVEGIATGAQFSYSGFLAGMRVGLSAAGVGDVNGDGFADAVTGVPYYDGSTMNDIGAFWFHAGGGGAGNRTPLPRQIYVGSATPIARLGQSDEPNGFRMRVLAFTPFGRSRVGLETEVKPAGQPFDGTGTDFSAVYSPSYLDGGLGGFTFGRYRGGLVSGRTYHWRARVRYSPAQCPFQPGGRWLTIPWGGWNEALVRINTALVDVPEAPEASVGVSLARPVPNPFGGATTIGFALPAAMPASLRVYDASGRRVRELLDEPRAEAGPHAIAWDGRDDAGRTAAPGVYFVRLVTPAGDATTRLVRMRE